MRGAERMGVKPPASPTQENLLFNTEQATVTLLVEAGSDRRFWERWIADEGVLVRDMGQGGRPKVEQELVRARSTPGAWLVAVVDADLDRLTGACTAQPDLIRTDAHDLEATLIGGPALEEVARYQAGEARKRAEAAWGEPLGQRLLRLAEGLGRLRWLKVARHPALDALRFKKKEGESSLKGRYADCAESGWTPSMECSVRVLCNVSQAQTLLPPNRDLAGEAMSLGPADLSQLCNGHDLVGFLQAWLGEVGGKTAPEVDELAARLALACSGDWLAGTQMARDLGAWEQAHHPRRVLCGGRKCWPLGSGNSGRFQGVASPPNPVEDRSAAPQNFRDPPRATRTFWPTSSARRGLVLPHVPRQRFSQGTTPIERNVRPHQAHHGRAN